MAHHLIEVKVFRNPSGQQLLPLRRTIAGETTLVRMTSSMLRLEILLKSGIEMAASMSRANEFMKPCVCRSGREKTWRINMAVSMAWFAYSSGRPRSPVFHRMPPIYCFLGKPDRDVAAPTQCSVVFGPVGYLVFRLAELVAATLVMFVGHWLFGQRKSTCIMPVRQIGGRLAIYSTKPSAAVACPGVCCERA